MRPDTTEVYEDHAGEWRWRRKAPNGEVIADSNESYTREADAKRAATRVFGAVDVAQAEAAEADTTGGMANPALNSNPAKPKSTY